MMCLRLRHRPSTRDFGGVKDTCNPYLLGGELNCQRWVCVANALVVAEISDRCHASYVVGTMFIIDRAWIILCNSNLARPLHGFAACLDMNKGLEVSSIIIQTVFQRCVLFS